jgi:hypothetical protein
MSEITAAFLGRRAIPMACQRVRSLEELLEHSRTSFVRGDGRMVRLQGKMAPYVSPGCPREHLTPVPARPRVWSRER